MYQSRLAFAAAPEDASAPESASASVSASVPAAPHWSGFIGFEGVHTGDGRFISHGALVWEAPLPLLINMEDNTAHGGVVCGRIDFMERQPSGEIYAEGVFDLDSEAGRAAARLVVNKMMRGVSFDLRADAEVQYMDDGINFTRAEVAGAHIVAIPAFKDARMIAVGEFRSRTTSQRQAAARAGHALPDGSFPIEDLHDLRNAIQAIGRASDPVAARAHIKRRAAALGYPDLIPYEWSSGILAFAQVADLLVVPTPEADALAADLARDALAASAKEILHGL